MGRWWCVGWNGEERITKKRTKNKAKTTKPDSEWKSRKRQSQMNTKFLNTLPPEWSKFVTDVKLVRDLHTTNIDQLHAYLGQHEFHANEVHLMHERNSDPLALVATHQMTQSPYPTHQHSYQNSQFQPQVSPYQSPQHGSPYQSQQYSNNQSSTPLSITYPSNDYQSSVHHNVYSPPSSIPQLEYAPIVNQQSEFPQLDSGLIVLVFQKGDDPIDAINHMMSFLTVVVTSRYPTTNNQLRNSSNPRQQATINDGRVTLQPIQGRHTSFAAGTYTSGESGSNSRKQRTVICYTCKGEGHMSKQCTKPKRKWGINSWLRIKLLVQAQANGQILDEKELALLADPGIVEGQATQTVITHNAAYQANDLDAYDSHCYELITAKVALMVKLSYLCFRCTHAEIFETRFVPQTELFAEQAFWSQNAVNSPKPTLSNRPTKVEVPQELSKVNMVNTSLKKLKHHIAGFNVVVKERTTTTTITEGSWGFEHTKACFRDEIIPFAVEQHRLESKTFEVKMNKVLNENERLLEQIISKDIVNIIVNSSVDNTSVNVHECVKCLKLETELLNKKDFIEKEIYDNLFKSFTTLEKHCISLEVDTQLNQEIFQRDNSVSNQSAPSFDQYFELNELKAQSQEKDTVIKKKKVLVITALKDELRKLKRKALVDNDVTKHTIDPEMLKIDVEPITPKLLNKRTTHSAYIKHTQEEAAVLRDLVDHVKANYPLDHSLESACSGLWTQEQRTKRVRFTEPVTSSGNTITKTASTSNLVSNKPMLSSTGVKPSTSASGSQPSSNTKKDKIQQTPSSTQKNKVEAHPRKVKSSLKNKDCVVAPKGTANVQHSKLNANSELKCVKCNGCMLSDNHDLCVLDFINNVNARVKSKSIKKSSKRKVWKPTGKVFTNIGYIWRPTGRTFTIVGNACPLTRITTTTEVPLRKPTVLDNEIPKPVVTLVYSRKPRKSKTNVPVSKSKVVQIVLWYLDSGCSKHMTGDRSQLTNFVNKFLGTVKFENDHVAKILGYGDYQIGNVTISRVYYVEGLEHNLFFVGQFCDSNLEVAFHQHTCFIHNLEGVDLLTGSRGNNLYTLSLRDMMASSPICLLSKASKTKTDNATKFVNQTLREYYEKVGISHETSVARSPQQNGVIERRNRTLIEAACTMLIYAKALLFLWAEVVSSFFHVFGALCYPINDSDNLGKLQPKADIDFDELTAMASEHSSSGPALHEMTPAIISSGLVQTLLLQHRLYHHSRTDWDLLFQPLFDELLNPPSSVDNPAPEVIAPIAEVVAPEPTTSTGSPSSTTVDQDAPSPSNSHTTPETQSLVISNDVEEDNHDLDIAHMNNVPNLEF
ncbi:retrovirus-related pol polyprotein from transposon TNT 1-94 [Tanacetum coccineum]|uniref:Retrovirus-related pol polyprotein from transposon TNT 1-94 n=1 Tax=Tanacetum coccineum TaxID=301880 RepID=A0ABQ5H8L8_9ASTR